MSAAGRRTAIRAGWVIAFDGRGHRLLRDARVVVEGERIAHLGSSPLDRSFVEDRGSPQFWYSGVFEYLPVRDGAQDLEGTLAWRHHRVGHRAPRRRRRMWPRMRQHDWGGRGVDELSPHTYRAWDDR